MSSRASPARWSALPCHRALLGFAAVVMTGGCSKPLVEAECVELLDHYVELLLKADNPGTSAQERLRLKEEARVKARRDPAFAQCSSEVGRSQFECAMEATHPDRLEQCLL